MPERFEPLERYDLSLNAIAMVLLTLTFVLTGVHILLAALLGLAGMLAVNAVYLWYNRLWDAAISRLRNEGQRTRMFR